MGSSATAQTGVPTSHADEPTQDYTICGVRFTDSELVLTTGYYFNRRELRLPLSRFPALAQATEDDRRCFAMHKLHSVIYWWRLKEKLVAKDAEAGALTERRPDHVSEYDFIYA